MLVKGATGDSVQFPDSGFESCIPTEEGNLSTFDSKIVCLCQSIEINNNRACMYLCDVCLYVFMYVYMYMTLIIGGKYNSQEI